MYKAAGRSAQRRRERALALAVERRESVKEVPEHVRRAFTSGALLVGRVKDEVKGGYLIQLRGCEAFCPGSEMYPRVPKGTLPDMQQRVEFAVIRIGTRDVVVSRRQAARLTAFRVAQAALVSGRPIAGIVEDVVPYGVFVDLGGVVGLLHVSEALSAGQRDLSAHVTKGALCDVIVRSIQRDTGRIALSVAVPLDLQQARPKGRADQPAFGDRRLSSTPKRRRGKDVQHRLAQSSPKLKRTDPSRATEWEKRWRAEWQADPNAAPQRRGSVHALQGGRPDSNRRRH